jgi:hypothetical protein
LPLDPIVILDYYQLNENTTCGNITEIFPGFAISCIAPPGLAADVAVIVCNGSCEELYLDAFLEANVAPTITNVSSIPTTGGYITITGPPGSFGPDLSYVLEVILYVTYGDTVPCNDVEMLVPYEVLTCELPPGSGLGTIVVYTFGGSNAFPFSYLPPVISNVYPDPPTSGNVNITVVGENFDPTPGYTVVYVDGEDSVDLIYVTYNYLVFVCPPGVGSNIPIEGKSFIRSPQDSPMSFLCAHVNVVL